jgi:uracil-DNA glycosylase
MTPTYDPRAAGARCDECTLGGVGQAPRCVPPGGSKVARIALVGEAPGKNEQIKLQPFVGASGIKLDEMLWHVGLRRSEVFISNAALCRPEIPNSTSPNRFSSEEYMKWIAIENKSRKRTAKAEKAPYVPLLDPFAACRPRLLRELYNLDLNARAAGAPNGVVVVPLGNFALKTLRGLTGITKYRGSVFPPRADDFKELSTTYHAVAAGLEGPQHGHRSGQGAAGAQHQEEA